MTQDDVLKALSTVQEPDLGKDLVTLNMVRDITIEGNYVSFTVVLTTPACPLKDKIKYDCIQAIKNTIDSAATVKVNFTSSTTTIRADKSTVLPGVKNIIAVVSGKGGVGHGAAVGALDGDAYCWYTLQAVCRHDDPVQLHHRIFYGLELGVGLFGSQEAKED